MRNPTDSASNQGLASRSGQQERGAVAGLRPSEHTRAIDVPKANARQLGAGAPQHKTPVQLCSTQQPPTPHGKQKQAAKRQPQAAAGAAWLDAASVPAGTQIVLLRCCGCPGSTTVHRADCHSLDRRQLAPTEPADQLLTGRALAPNAPDKTGKKGEGGIMKASLKSKLLSGAQHACSARLSLLLGGKCVAGLYERAASAAQQLPVGSESTNARPTAVTLGRAHHGARPGSVPGGAGGGGWASSPLAGPLTGAWLGCWLLCGAAAAVLGCAEATCAACLVSGHSSPCRGW